MALNENQGPAPYVHRRRKSVVRELFQMLMCIPSGPKHRTSLHRAVDGPRAFARVRQRSDGVLYVLRNRFHARGGPAEVVALGKRNIKRDQLLQLRSRLHAFGDDPRVKPTGNGADHLDQRLTRRIEVTPSDEATIQLQKIGTHFHYVLDTRLPRTHLLPAPPPPLAPTPHLIFP